MLIDCRRVIRLYGSACRFHRKIEVASERTTREKLMCDLMLQAKQQGSLEFEIRYDRQELADYLKVERSGLLAEIGKLCRQGTIETRRRRFKICRTPAS